jgi:hypothetical protein
MLAETVVVSGSVKVANNGQLILARGARANRPSNADTGSLWLETSASGSVVMIYTGVNAENADSGWEVLGTQDTSRVAFKYRDIINYAYVAGGYKDASPWKTVHRTVVATDQTTNVGDLLDYPSSYSVGACNKRILFMFSVTTSGIWQGPQDITDTYTSAVNMVTETNYAHQNKFDLANARGQPGVPFQETENCWICGGGAAITVVEKMNLTNESMYTKTWVTNASSLGLSAFSDEDFGYLYGSENGQKLFFATDTFQNKTQWGASGQQKGISSKVGKGYAGNEGTYNGGYNLRRWDYATESNIGNVAKPYGNSGEENFTMGQDWQYMLGMYDGVQNNESWKFYYSTDTGINNVAGLKPYAHGGQSSGHCGWKN